MPEPVNIQPLFDAFTAAGNDVAAVKARFAQELADATARLDAARTALLAVMPENVEFSTAPSPPPIVKRVGTEIHLVAKPFIGEPYTPGE